MSDNVLQPEVTIAGVVGSLGDLVDGPKENPDDESGVIADDPPADGELTGEIGRLRQRMDAGDSLTLADISVRACLEPALELLTSDNVDDRVKGARILISLKVQAAKFANVEAALGGRSSGGGEGSDPELDALLDETQSLWAGLEEK